MTNQEHVTGSFEIHVFVEPLDPGPEAIEAFRAACVAAPSPMKALLASDAALSPADRCFEVHVLIDGKASPLSEEDMRSLRGIAADFSARLGTPVPLSYNALKPSQRFLNLRARGVGLDQAMEPVAALERAVAAAGDLVVKKVIAEYICFDSNRAVDSGWLEPLS